MNGCDPMLDDNYQDALKDARAELTPTVNYDTDGTAWMTVRYVIDVQVMADNAGDALYYADLALQDNLGGAEGTVL